MSISDDQTPPGAPRTGQRILPTDPLPVVWWLAVMAALVWMCLPALSLLMTRGGDDLSKMSLKALPPRDVVIMVITGAGGGALTLLLGMALFWPAGYSRLGISSRQLPRGLAAGLLASLIVLPLMAGVMFGTEWFWKILEFKHPAEHDLLQILSGTSDPALRIAIIASAILLAPLFEELLFRGFLQSAVLATLNRWSASGEVSAPSIAWQGWVAILIASIAFTAVHEHLWLMPPIFFLSLCLGYVYERTGNLWAAIALHAIFNAASTAIFLATR